MAQYFFRTRIGRDDTGSRSITGNLRVTTPDSQSRSRSRRRRHRTDDRDRRRHSSVIDYTYAGQARYPGEDVEQHRRPRSSVRLYGDEYTNGDPDHHDSNHSRRNLPADAYNTNEARYQNLSAEFDREYSLPDEDGPTQTRALAIEDRNRRTSRSVSPAMQVSHEATWPPERSNESNPPQYNGYVTHLSTTADTASREPIPAPPRYTVSLHDPVTLLPSNENSGTTSSSQSLPLGPNASSLGDSGAYRPAEPDVLPSAGNQSSPSGTVSRQPEAQNHLSLARGRAEKGSQRRAYGDHIEDGVSTILPQSTSAPRPGRGGGPRPPLPHANTMLSVHDNNSSARVQIQQQNAGTLSRSLSVGSASRTARGEPVIDIRNHQVDANPIPPLRDQVTGSPDAGISELRVPLEGHMHSGYQDQPSTRCLSCTSLKSPSTDVGTRDLRPRSRSDVSQSSVSGADPTEELMSRMRSRTVSSRSATAAPMLNRPGSTTGGAPHSQHGYQYMRLRTEKDHEEFRLVRLLPKMMSKIQCEIIHQPLRNHTDYIAISYAWGDGIGHESLELDGTTISVGISLFQALQALRQEKNEILVWVDALCIDQQNKTEQAQQVLLMGRIYTQAVSVAIWIGPEADESGLAMQLLQDVSEDTVTPQRIRSVRQYPDSAALLTVFKRDYWRRLWVVQEVLLARKKIVYCGRSCFPWEVYRKAAFALWDDQSDPHIRKGPRSFPDQSDLLQYGNESLLEGLRAFRKKLSENPRDKVFGILGMVVPVTQHALAVNYNLSVKTVYTDVVDHLISWTGRIDVIRESIHYPLHTNTTGLPTWCPDWSHVPDVSGLGRTLGFHASNDANGPTRARYEFHDARRKLEISAIKLDVVKATGTAVSTFCESQDYLTAFVNWQAKFLHELHIEQGNRSHRLHEVFCRTLCLGQVPADQSPQSWHKLCYHVFASMLKEKLPRLPMDPDLACYVSDTGLIDPKARRKFLQVHFGNRMTGRSFGITDQGLIGMGSGYMTKGDIVVIPYGCSTPILLRPEGSRNEYRYIGDVYVDGYMHGEAFKQQPRREDEKYMLC